MRSDQKEATYPYLVIYQVASVIFYNVGMFARIQESYFIEICTFHLLGDVGQLFDCNLL